MEGLGAAFDAVYRLGIAAVWVAVIALPFAIWKWIEIVVWIFKHIQVDFL